mmetsp:Transcript_13628/g.38353  ORF Transcript_13628/g.38353 Transcript_13628/m.38353 type:complete len:211 (+) Transcript_13628:224-856(+)|eukprot:CAMPEP_0172361010 /NCGR_PEP_ID=MMETSP1060-20121228/4921_1 /TAXON_ID=37318 /ORGANISM="Pseudo-nitzschia pungens, Strain cf. cingulata" /LENGTH=210 /DNA_ID=CAMNT_0013083147 /DNA_START=194 /DNA_END=826 /DNA_ORIENTATION=-
MSESYEDYEREYNACLSRIRSFLAASTRSATTLKECERLLAQAKQHATAMQGLAEVEGNPMKIRETSQKVERDILPLSREVARALGNADGGREELFYQAPAVNGRDYGYNSGDMESLIGSSESMLRESLSLTMETERIGNSTLEQMYQQREQLEGARDNLTRTREIVNQAAFVLTELSRKAFYSKIFLYAAVGILIFLNFWALTRLFNKN